MINGSVSEQSARELKITVRLNSNIKNELKTTKTLVLNIFGAEKAVFSPLIYKTTYNYISDPPVKRKKEYGF